MNIVGFLHAIGGQFTAALAVAARIRKQDRVAMFQQQLSISCHAFAIVGNPMQQNYGIAVVLAWMDEPTFERYAVSGDDRHILQFSAEISSHGGGDGRLMAQRKPMEFEARISDDDASQNRESKVGYEARKKDFTKDMKFLNRWLRAFGRSHVFRTNQTSILKTFADGTNYKHPTANFVIAIWSRQIYLSVTFNAVVKPVFTVALVLTLANPGAATVTV